MSRKRRKRKSHPKQSSAALRSNGLRAFKRRDYAGAIEAWERTGKQAPKMLPTAALAEAHFRLGLERLYGRPNRPALSADMEAGLQALRRAVRLQPDSPCYNLHWGLAEHHQGNIDDAIRAYRMVRKSADASANEFARRAAYPLALALLQQGKSPAQDSVWADLPNDEQTMLIQAKGFRARPYATSSDAPLLWQGLAALGKGMVEQAKTDLVQATGRADQRKQGAVAHYYLGVLAAKQKDWEETGRQWTATRAAGLTSPWLEANMGELYHQLAEDWLQKENLEDALGAASEAIRHKPGDKRLGELISQIYQQLGYQAASAGDWATALEKWRKAQDAGGGSFRVAYNLALAYEHVEDWAAAGKTWRGALRRRPRRADHPDAVTGEQVARLWRRAAEAYHRAGDYEESVHVYRQALKWNPDDIDTRMLLVDGLLSDGRLQAAENELERTLERDPNHIPALLRIGEVIAESGRWWRQRSAPEYWKKVLELEPEHAEARQLLADYFVDQAEDYLYWGRSTHAVESYVEALRYQPKNGSTLAALGGCYLKMGQSEKAHSHIEQALSYAGNDLDVYGQVIGVWLQQKDIDQAKQVMAQAEATIQNIPCTFYVIQAGLCIGQDILDLAHVWLDRAIEKATPDVPVFVLIGEMLVTTGASEMGHEYLEKAIRVGQYVGQACLMRGILYAKDRDFETAERYWDRAEKVARKERDSELKERVQLARMMFSMPQGLFNMLMNNPSLLNQEGLFGGFPFPGSFDDDEDDDDDGFFF